MGLQNGNGHVVPEDKEYASGGSAFTSSTAHLLENGVHRRSLEDRSDYRGPPDFESRDDDSYYTTGRTRSLSNQIFHRRKPFHVIISFIVLLATFWLGAKYGATQSHYTTSICNPLPASPPSPDLALSNFSPAIDYPRRTFKYTNGSLFEKPKKMKIIGIIFFGRRQFVDILDCYLRRNLVVNGGMLDEVHFLMHTDDEADKDWLRNMVKTHHMGDYFKLKAEATDAGWNKWTSFQDLYKNFMTDPDAIYVKIDDDLLFIDDFAIPELIKTILEHPEAHSVVSNNVNNRWNYWHHHRTDAIFPYLAEQDPNTQWSIDSWRPSELPTYDGTLPPKMHNFSRDYKSPSDGHRWLPLRNGKSRAESVSHTPWGPWLPNPMFHTGRESASWPVVAQAHYSFFENLERGQLNKYYFGNGQDHIWNLWYSRWNINFMAIKGANILLKPFWGDDFADLDKGDEYLLTTVIPKDLDMPVLVATRSITSHYSFRGDREFVLHTDVLDRYRALANELYCAIGNQKKRFGEPIGPHHIPDSSRSSAGDVEQKEADWSSAAGASGAGGVEVVGDGPADVFNPDASTGNMDDIKSNVADPINAPA